MSGNDSRRSQAQAACNSCRKRKSRCKFDDTDQTVCLMCKMHGSECTFPESSAESSRSSPAVRRDRKLKARRLPSSWASASPVPSSLGRDRRSSTNSQHTCRETVRDKENEREGTVPTRLDRSEDHIDDTSETEQVQRDAADLSTNYTTNDRINEPKDNHGLVSVSVICGNFIQNNAGRRPDIWDRYRLLPIANVPASTTAESKCTLITQLIEPSRKQIIDGHSQSLEVDSRNDSQGACLQAAPDKQRHPNLRYIWEQADLALTSELHAPSGVSTIVAILLRISGRPFTSMIRNKMLLSSAISLAYTLKLNRNPMCLHIYGAESCMRTRLWWAIVINDRWLSVVHGTPPLLKTSEHDVPKPASLPSDNNADAISPTFAALASLCDVLDTYLEYKFDLHNATSDRNIAIGQVIERQLSHWKDSLPDDLRREVINLYPPDAKLSTEGSANLRLAYLYVILIARKLVVTSTEREWKLAVDKTLLDYHRQHAISAAEEIASFVRDLKDNRNGMKDFYLPFAALCISDTAAFLLGSAYRYGVRKEYALQERCMEQASYMIANLTDLREISGWDLGDICLAKYADLIEPMLKSDDRTWEDVSGLREALRFNFSEVDQMAPKLWDLYNGV